MRIVVDAMGGDYAPGVVLEGVELALATDAELELILTGTAEVVEPFVARHERVQAVASSQIIAMDEHPAEAVRAKRDSSIVVGCKLVADGQAAGFFSAGSTGACMAAATLVMGRIKGIARPMIATSLPSKTGWVVLADAGANADVKPEYLLQFAQMATVYMREMFGIAAPRVGLLNIGSEASKGSELAQEAYRLLQENLDTFAGNAEGTELLSGRFDAVITDGFTGNVTLKTIEGAASMLFGELKGMLTSSTGGKLAALFVKSDLKALKDKFSADEVGGAPLLGVRGSCFIGHGSSNAKAIAAGIATTARASRAELPERIAEVILS